MILATEKNEKSLVQDVQQCQKKIWRFQEKV